ncbi:hypothetical protein CDAR_263461 [Caerostris darwini]|uniref:Secreted protein n=1 Tax=Caerostris darwini TaxID=1538125 RepID=A0AAV4RXQ5_9ARAC|nr:hypothetical protein CDAR_263461 [Caerostris darwini]
MLCNLWDVPCRQTTVATLPLGPLFGPLTRWWLLVSVSEAGQRPLCQGAPLSCQLQLALKEALRKFYVTHALNSTFLIQFFEMSRILEAILFC